LVGHTVAFHSVQVHVDANGDEVFHDFLYQLRRVFYILLGQIQNNNASGSDTDVNSIFAEFAATALGNYQWLCTLLLIGHVVFCFIVLLNILIAMMGDTYGEVKENADREWRLSYAQIIFSIESEMGKKRLSEIEYWATIGDKRYLQVIEVDKAWFNQTNVELASLDVNNDGVSREEIQKFEADAKKQGLQLVSTASTSGEELPTPRRESTSRDKARASISGSSGGKRVSLLETKTASDKPHIAEMDSLSNIGPKRLLSNRMNPSYGEE